MKIKTKTISTKYNVIEINKNNLHKLDILNGRLILREMEQSLFNLPDGQRVIDGTIMKNIVLNILDVSNSEINECGRL